MTPEVLFSSPQTQPRPSLRAKGILLCLSLAFAALLIEAVVRVIEHLQRSRPASTISSERPSRYYLPAGSVTNRGNGSPNHYDSANFRIAVVGDSFTFAPLMQAEDAFPARLERLLNLNRSGIDSAPEYAAVVNLGRPGFSTSHEVATVRSALSKKPSLVVLEITLNDPQLRRLNEEPPDVQGQFGPYRPTGFIRFLTEQWRTLHLLLSRIHNTQSIRSYINYHEYLFSNPVSRNGFVNSLDEISALCKEAKVPLAIVLFPLFDFPINESYPFGAIHQMIADNAHRLSVPILDLRSHFQGLDVYRLQLIPGKDTHPNEIAHRIAAEALLAFLSEQRLIPKGLIPRTILKKRDNYFQLKSKRKTGHS